MDLSHTPPFSIEKSSQGAKIIGIITDFFRKIPDHRKNNVSISLADALMSAYAIFSLKLPSLLSFEEAFRKKAKAKNLKGMYNVENIPSDTQMREIIDNIFPDKIKPLFKHLFNLVQRGKKLEAFNFADKKKDPIYLMPVDATGFFSSYKVNCPLCMSKKHSNGERTYYHQMLSAAIVHPNLKTVIPLCHEPIMKQASDEINDCELNAFGRLMENFRKDHPKLNVIITGDALYANLPAIKLIKNHQAGFILSVKPGSHKALFDFIKGSDERGHVNNYTIEKIIGDKVKKKVTLTFRFKNGVPLNERSTDLSLNFLECFETTEWDGKRGPQKIEKHFTWVTDLFLCTSNLIKIMEGGRARWTIENEVFNTLKNQGYNFEHNYGHGNQYLSSNFALMMMLAFFADQIQEMSCEFFKKLLKLKSAKYRVWEHLRTFFENFIFKDWTDFITGILEAAEGKYINSS